MTKRKTQKNECRRAGSEKAGRDMMMARVTTAVGRGDTGVLMRKERKRRQIKRAGKQKETRTAKSQIANNLSILKTRTHPHANLKYIQLGVTLDIHTRRGACMQLAMLIYSSCSLAATTACAFVSSTAASGALASLSPPSTGLRSRLLRSTFSYATWTTTARSFNSLPFNSSTAFACASVDSSSTNAKSLGGRWSLELPDLWNKDALTTVNPLALTHSAISSSVVPWARLRT
ncbi:hypothetical protein BCR44DRAFT_275588 [Catenaria anguillulae PL171]|uniref:Uncharacterized protein n=1 Tax=Catenaria anguillulae PL171 TaxID=765915 RepID=A0A1Y2H5C0_9FUNG|nr:hypothetical protein BCR44DRAFT_275588 [Catenaria anguillulae PL171]